MKSVYIDVDGYWGVLVLYGYDLIDFDDLLAVMRSLGMSKKAARKALRILSNDNTGMAVSSDELRMSAMFISKATSTSEFLNSIVHETAHIASSIAEYYEKPCDGEDFAYISGYLFQRIVEEIYDIR